MRSFLDDDFLLRTDTARMLYHEEAEKLPIIDYHCHLSPKEIAENKQFENLTDLMLGGDHYKWRAMLSYGIDESLIRGDGDPRQKFIAFAEMLEMAIGNPLYHWTHLELKRCFGVDAPLTRKNAGEIYDHASALLQTEEYRAKGLIDRFHVDYLCTTDDPADDLSFHQAIAAEGGLNARVLPAFRPDNALNLRQSGYPGYIKQLGRVCGMHIRSTADLLKALERRVEFFHACGARISDHALDELPPGEPSFKQADKAFEAAMKGKAVSDKHYAAFRTVMLAGLGGIYSQHGWAQQYHIGAMRNNNTAMLHRCGPNTGFDSVSDLSFAHALSRLLDLQDAQGQLPRTVLYALNPAENCVIGTMIGNFQQSGIRGKLQMGSAWWFQDHKRGMEEQLQSLASLGVLGTFVGMVTDSRSFISYPRHEYFRRILCDLLGEWVENGEYANDPEALRAIVRGICYDNAKQYFGI